MLFVGCIGPSSSEPISPCVGSCQGYNIGFSVEFHVTHEDSGHAEQRIVQQLARVDSHKESQKGLFVSPCAGLLVRSHNMNEASTDMTDVLVVCVRCSKTVTNDVICC